MVRTLESDIDFARCEISSALFGLENIGLEILRQFNLCDEGWNDNAQVNLYRSADMFYKKILVYINEWGSVWERLENLNLIDTPQNVLLHDLDMIIEDAWQAYYEKDALGFDILGTLDNVKEYVPGRLYNDLYITAESLKNCFEEEIDNLEDAIEFIERAKEEIKII